MKEFLPVSGFRSPASFLLFPVFFLLLVQSLAAAGSLEIQRPARTWEFMNAVGPKAAVLGRENGRFEAWVYPLKVLRDFRLTFQLGGRTIPAEAVVRSVVYRPESTTLVYSGDYYAEHFLVRQTFVVPHDEQAILIRLEIDTSSQLRLGARFCQDFDLMWPAGLQAAFGGWDEPLDGFVMGAEGSPFRALVASPGARLADRNYATNYSESEESAFTVGTFQGPSEAWIVIAASFESREELVAAYRRLTADPSRYQEEVRQAYQKRLDETVQLSLPDPVLQQAYDWSRISMAKGLVENPFLKGKGLVAGFGLSKGAPRPGFAWFFGRDTFWSSLALTAAGDLSTARAAIAFIAQHQRQDGKIPHEIAQSASFIPWFEDYPYAYASADSTPLFIIALGDYVRASGDLSLLEENWGRLLKAREFMRSSADQDGFARNQDVGHGWVEGGPLLPVRTEFYQAGVSVEALRVLGELAGLKGESDLARQLGDEFQAGKRKLEEVFWLARQNRYAWAVDLQDQPVDEPSILSTVPMWFGLLERQRCQLMLPQLASEDHLSDWGSRIISSQSPNYGPAGYHFGSVWPLFTGWASMGNYQYHFAHAGWANLQANAHLALDGAGGHTTEVVSGAVYSPLSTSSPHQIWSAAMVVSPLLRGLLGLQADSPGRRVRLRPHLPADWDRFQIEGLPLGGSRLDLSFQRDEKSFALSIRNPSKQPLELSFAPALAPSAHISSARFNGQPASWTRLDGVTDWHPVFSLAVPAGESRLEIRLENDFGVTFEAPLPVLGNPSSNLKLLSQTWRGSEGVDLQISGRAGRAYQLHLHGGARAESAQGAELDNAARTLTVRFPPGQGYLRQTVKLQLRPVQK